MADDAPERERDATERRAQPWVIEIPGVGTVEYPATMTAEEVDREVRRVAGATAAAPAPPAASATELETATPFTSRFWTAVGPKRRHGGFLWQAAEPFATVVAPGVPFPLRVLQAVGAPFQAVGQVVEKGLEEIAGASTPATRVGGLAAEFAVPTGAVLAPVKLAARGARAGTQAATQLVTRVAAGTAAPSLFGGATYGYLFAPLLSRLESLHPAGRLLVNREAHALQAAYKWFGQQVIPLVDELDAAFKKMSLDEVKNFVEVADAGAAPLTPRVDAAVQAFRRVWGPQGAAVHDAARAGITITPREHFFMREFSPAFIRDVRENKSVRSQLVRQLMARMGVDRETARFYVREYFLKRRYPLHGRKTPAEFPREVDVPGFLGDPSRATSATQLAQEITQAIIRRGAKLARRIGEATAYGPNDEILHGILTQVPDLHTRDAIRQVLKDLLGKPSLDEELAKLSRRVLSVMAVIHLPLAALANLTQPAVIGALRTTIPTAIRGLANFLSHPKTSLQAAQTVGVFTDLVTRRFFAELGGQELPRWLRSPLGLFNASERIIRGVSYEMGKLWAERLQRELTTAVTPKRLGWLHREFERLGFHPDEVSRITQTRRLLPDDVDKIAFSIADQIVFMPREARRSAFYNTAVGPILLQFKSFVANTNRAIRTAIWDEARAGNYVPLFRILGLLPFYTALGEVTADVNAIIRGRTRPPLSDPLWRAVDNLTSLGALGMWLDVVRSAGRAGGLASWAAGPLVGDISDLAARVWFFLNALRLRDPAEARLQLANLGRGLVRFVPVVGGTLGPLLTSPAGPFPSPRLSRRERQQTVWDRLGVTRRAVLEAQAREHERRRRAQRTLQQYLEE